MATTIGETITDDNNQDKDMTGFDPSWINFSHFVIFSGTNLRNVGLYLFSTVYLAGWRANTRNQK